MDNQDVDWTLRRFLTGLPHLTEPRSEHVSFL